MSGENEAVARSFFEMQDKECRTPLELLAPDFTAHMAGAPPLDAHGFDEREGLFFASFSDIRHVIEDMISEDDRVAFRIRLEGTHSGDFMGIPVSNNQISFSAMGFMRVADGRIAEFWGIPDIGSLMQQISPAPASEQAADG